MNVCTVASGVAGAVSLQDRRQVEAHSYSRRLQPAGLSGEVGETYIKDVSTPLPRAAKRQAGAERWRLRRGRSGGGPDRRWPLLPDRARARPGGSRVPAAGRAAGCRPRRAATVTACWSLPGLLASDMSTICAAPVPAQLAGLPRARLAAGPQPWARPSGSSTSCPRELAALAERTGGPVSVIGWSLGGIYARELARQQPGAGPAGDHARQPVRADRRAAEPRRPRLPAARALHATRPGADAGAGGPADRRCRRRRSTPGHDGIVAWRACIEPGDGAARERRGPVRSPRLRHRSGDTVAGR